MLHKLFLLTSIFYLFSFNSYSQSREINLEGKVIDGNKKAAIHALLRLKKSNIIVYTDQKGNFLFSCLEPHLDTLTIEYIGCKIRSIPVLIRKNQNLNLGLIFLENTIISLQNIEIKGRIAHSYKSDYSFYGNKTQMAVMDIPQSITAITKEILKDKMEFTLKDALQEVSGLNQYSGFDEYSIRGFHADNAHDINGLRSYNAFYGSNLLFNIERIELIKGPTATLYGNCDPGGTINLVTKKPLENIEGEINVFGGSWDHYRIQGDLTGPLNSSKTLLYRINAGFDTSRSFRNQVFSKSYQIAPSFSFIPNDRFKINVDFSYSKQNTVLDRGQPGLQGNSNLLSTPIGLSISQKGDYLHQTDFSAILAASYKINQKLTYAMGYLNNHITQNVAEHGINDYLSPDSVSLYYSTWSYKITTNTLTNYLTYKFNWGKMIHQFLLGYDYIRARVNLNQNFYELIDPFGAGSGIVGTFSLSHPVYSDRPVSDYTLSTNQIDAAGVDGTVFHTQGFYFQDQINYNRFKILFSFREELYRGGDTIGGIKSNVFLPRIGIVYSLKPNLNLYATYNQGFDPYEPSSTLKVFNAPYKPVTSKLLETGLKGNFFDNKLSASLAIYQLTLYNVAVNANDTLNPNLFIQQGENRSKGVELEAAGSITSNLNVSLFYSYCDAKVLKSQVPFQIGMDVENSPRSTSGSWIKYSINQGMLKGLGFSIGHSSQGKRNTLDSAIQLPSFFTLKMGANYTFHRFNLAILVNNLTNKTYWTGSYNNIYKWPGQPRNFLINLGYKF